MTLWAAISLLGIMLVLAAIPSASVALVVSRSATHGFANGAAVALGIVLGDLIFVALAILGMSVLAETMGAAFAIVKYIGGAYLIWMGVSLLRAKGGIQGTESTPTRMSLAASFTSGLLLTLGDLKAIIFYASLFPAFVDMSRLTPTHVAWIIFVTIVAVGGVKLIYAAAARAIVSRIQNPKKQKLARSAAGCCMVGAGTYLIVKS
ncbi:MAG: LysE family translocator [Puniceicoccales bacterium]